MGIADGDDGDVVALEDPADAPETLVPVGAGRHASEAAPAGRLNAAIARAVVHIHRSYVGRGPTKAQSFFRGDVLVVVLEDVLTKGERTLVDSGGADTVLKLRARFHAAMAAELRERIEELTGRRVVALMSADHIGPDMSVEVAVLDRPLEGSSGDGPSPRGDSNP